MRRRLGDAGRQGVMSSRAAASGFPPKSRQSGGTQSWAGRCRAGVQRERVLDACEPVVDGIEHPSHARFRTVVRLGRHMAGEIIDVIQRQVNNQVGPTRRCATEVPFHLVVDERPFENQVSLLPRQPDVHELSRLDLLAPHHISRLGTQMAPSLPTNVSPSIAIRQVPSAWRIAVQSAMNASAAS